MVRNLKVIFVGLVVFYFVGGLYFTKEACIEDTIKELYGNEFEEIMEFSHNGITKTLMVNPENKTVSIVGTKRFLGFYHTASSSTGMQIDERFSFDLFATYHSDYGMVMFIYRNNPQIDYIKAEFDDGEQLVLKEWKSDFVGFLLDTNEWKGGTYKAYDLSDNLIEERQY